MAFQSYLVERDLRLNLEFDIAWANQFILGHPLMPEMPVNLLDPSHHSFIEQIIPTLQQRNIALLAMKTLADGRFFPKRIKLDKVQGETDKPIVPDRVSVEQALQFVWSLPVSVLITGAENADLMREKIALAHDFVGLTQRDRQVPIDEVADLAEDGKIEYFKKIV